MPEKIPVKQKTETKVESTASHETERAFESLDSHTMAFIKGGHIDIPDMADFEPAKTLAEVKNFTRHLSKENSSFARAALMRDFHEKLGIFRRNVVKAQLLMEGALNQKVNAGSRILRAELKKIIEICSVQALEKTFNTALDRFISARTAVKKTVREYRRKYKENWQNKLFEDLFNKPPKGTVKIEVMPINILFRLYNLEDFAVAFLGPELKGYNEDDLRASGGAKLERYFDIPGLQDAILLENMSVINNDAPSVKERLKAHEEEHSIHSTFYPTSTMIRHERSFLSLKKEATIDDLLKSLRTYARYYDQLWKQGAKSEFLAYWKAQQYSSEVIHEILLKEGDLYDYFTSPISGDEYGFPNEVIKHIKNMGITVTDPNGQVLSEEKIRFAAWKIITQTWEIYKKDVTKALNAVAEMERIYGNNPEARLQILRLLSQEPLEKWGRLSKVLL